jgi:hypothetical protein
MFYKKCQSSDLKHSPKPKGEAENPAGIFKYWRISE